MILGKSTFFPLLFGFLEESLEKEGLEYPFCYRHSNQISDLLVEIYMELSKLIT